MPEKKKPVFACEVYPGCPNREEAIVTTNGDADIEEGFGPTTSISFVKVKGACKKECHIQKMDTPASHSAIAIIGGRIVQFGS